MTKNVGYCNFLWKGPQPFQTDAFRKNHLTDTTECLQGKGQFKGEITSTVTDTDKKTVIIDEAVKVITVTDEVRKKAVQNLEGAKNNCQSLANKFRITNLTLSVTAGVLTAAGAIISVAFPALIPVAFALFVIAIAVLGIGSFIKYRQDQANNQATILRHEKARWADPVLNIQEQRQQVATLGFSYAQTLRGKLVSTAELKQLFKVEVQNFKRLFDDSQQLSNAHKLRRINEFFSSPVWNVLSSAENYKKIFGEENVDMDFQGLINSLSKLNAETKVCAKKIETFRQELSKQQSALIQQVHAKEKQWIKFVHEAFRAIEYPWVAQHKTNMQNGIPGFWSFAQLNMQNLYSAKWNLEEQVHDWSNRKITEIGNDNCEWLRESNLITNKVNLTKFNFISASLDAFCSASIHCLPPIDINLKLVDKIDTRFEIVEPYFKPEWAKMIVKSEWTDLMAKCKAKAAELNPAAG